ncbi:hypothetical protein [Streptomyces graminilatus]|uniref:hypothetical protein n=1 Tax=Streptomyces graminilatus TaxID=1464070 RepID=UPI0006E44CAB|nr:hypothetical protein [Streptomyces graminilatus]
MYPKPENSEVTDRMRAAHHRARTALRVEPAPDEFEAWGWRGRTLSRPVTAADGSAWLRLASAPTGQADNTFWDGSRDAENAIPSSVPRPRLREIRDWTDQEWKYRAELYDHVDARSIAQSPTLTTVPDLPSAWWTALHAALATVTDIPTDRCTIEQQYLDWAMPKFLGTPIDTRAPDWATAHGDLHWANVCAPQLTIFDWEGWGLAPTGYDAAMLHSYSLLTPSIAARVRAEFADVLDTPAGHFAELVTITELLHGVERGGNLPLAEPLRQRAAHLLERAIR